MFDECFVYVSECMLSWLFGYCCNDDGLFVFVYVMVIEVQLCGFVIDLLGYWLIVCGEQFEYVVVYVIVLDDGMLLLYVCVLGGCGVNWVVIV